VYNYRENSVTKLEVEKLLKKHGFVKRPGGRHDIWIKRGFPPIPASGLEDMR